MHGRAWKRDTSMPPACGGKQIEAGVAMGRRREIMTATSGASCAQVGGGHAAYHSGCTSSDVVWLASIGALNGQQPGNCQRDLFVRYCKDLWSPAAYKILVPMHAMNQATRANDIFHKNIDMLLPHRWLASLDNNGQLESLWRTDLLQSFWEGQSVESNPKYKANPGCKGMIPIMLHADGGQFTKRDSLMVMSMRSILTTASVADSMLLLAAIPKKARCQMSKEGCDTWDNIWEVLVWSFTAMFEGKWPTKSWDGKPLCKDDERLAGKSLCPNSGLKAVIWTISGDMEYYANELGISKYGSNIPCSWCSGDYDPDRPYNDFRDTAAWRATVVTAPASSADNPCKHAVMKIPGVIFETIYIDTLHVVDLGISLHCIGNLFSDLCIREWDGTQQKNLAKLSAEVLKLQQDFNIPAGSRGQALDLKHFIAKGGAYPILHGWKAREVRNLIPVCYALATAARVSSSSEYTLQREQVFKHLNDICEAVDAHHWCLPTSAKVDFRYNVDCFLLHYTWLAKYAANNKRTQWSIVPKFHFLAHLPAMAEHLAPRAAWTYPGESMVGTITSLAQSCTHGTSALHLTKPLIAKYRIAMHLRAKMCWDQP